MRCDDETVFNVLHRMNGLRDEMAIICTFVTMPTMHVRCVCVVSRNTLVWFYFFRRVFITY